MRLINEISIILPITKIELVNGLLEETVDEFESMIDLNSDK